MERVLMGAVTLRCQLPASAVTRSGRFQLKILEPCFSSCEKQDSQIRTAPLPRSPCWQTCLLLPADLVYSGTLATLGTHIGDPSLLPIQPTSSASTLSTGESLCTGYWARQEGNQDTYTV